VEVVSLPYFFLSVEIVSLPWFSMWRLYLYLSFICKACISTLVLSVRLYLYLCFVCGGCNSALVLSLEVVSLPWFYLCKFYLYLGCYPWRLYLELSPRCWSASHPEQQEILYQEVVGAVGPPSTTTPITRSTLLKLAYLRACLVGFPRICPSPS
jgi:hypothetical protein